MDISIFLAQALGLFLVISGVALLVRPQAMKDLTDVFSGNRAAVMMGGYLSLIVGIPLVLVHSVWDGALWQTVISVLAWLTLVKDVVRVFAPDTVVSWGRALQRSMGLLKLIILVMVLVGLYLLYVGFGLSL